MVPGAATDDHGTMQAGRRAGTAPALRFVSKPVDPKKLVAAAKEALAEELEEEDLAS